MLLAPELATKGAWKRFRSQYPTSVAPGLRAHQAEDEVGEARQLVDGNLGAGGPLSTASDVLAMLYYHIRAFGTYVTALPLLLRIDGLVRLFRSVLDSCGLVRVIRNPGSWHTAGRVSRDPAESAPGDEAGSAFMLCHEPVQELAELLEHVRGLGQNGHVTDAQRVHI